MTEFLNTVFLSIVQGLTEFIPISSSGHLVFFEKVLSYHSQNDSHLLNVVLHFGTMVSTFVVFKQELIDMIKTFFSKDFFQSLKNMDEMKSNDSKWLIFIIIIGTIPTVIIGFFFRDLFKSLGDSLFYTSFAFLATGAILISTRFVKHGSKDEYSKITIWDTLLIGFVQGIAITPGISRSGITISSGLWQGISREKMGRYSFLLSVPAIFGATVLELSKVTWANLNVWLLVIGFLVSFAIGYYSLKLLLNFVNRGKLQYFSYYCWAIGIISLVIAISRGI